MNYHPFTEEGHYCPTCDDVHSICTMEDGQCDNQGECSTCIGERVRNQAATMHPLDIAEMEYRHDMLERGY